VETYDNANGGRIVTSADADGNTITYTYTAGGLLDRATTQDGGYVSFVYTSGNLTKLVTTYFDAATQTTKSLTRVYYGYDASNRLTSVTVDLSPGDNATTDGKTYVTTYTYSGTSNRVASITQSDGSQLQIAYVMVGSTYQVQSMAQTAATGVTRTTTFAYDTTNRVTTVTDPLGNVSRLSYDAAGRLIQVAAPAPTAR
jgi:YD repeat-containing protein